jgi:hypothetical protein
MQHRQTPRRREIDDDSKDDDEFFLGSVNLEELAKRREERAIAMYPFVQVHL